MSEITKLYENAGIKPDCTYLFLVDVNGENEAARTVSIGSKADLKRLIVDCGVKGRVIKSTNTLKPFYPPFTAEKQIKLLEFNYKYSRVPDIGYIIELKKYDCPHYDNYGAFDTFQEALCADINYHWEYFTEEEKQQVKGILE